MTKNPPHAQVQKVQNFIGNINVTTGFHALKKNRGTIGLTDLIAPIVNQQNQSQQCRA